MKNSTTKSRAKRSKRCVRRITWRECAPLYGTVTNFFSIDTVYRKFLSSGGKNLGIPFYFRVEYDADGKPIYMEGKIPCHPRYIPIKGIEAKADIIDLYADNFYGAIRKERVGWYFTWNFVDGTSITFYVREGSKVIHTLIPIRSLKRRRA